MKTIVKQIKNLGEGFWERLGRREPIATNLHKQYIRELHIEAYKEVLGLEEYKRIFGE